MYDNKDKLLAGSTESHSPCKNEAPINCFQNMLYILCQPGTYGYHILHKLPAYCITTTSVFINEIIVMSCCNKYVLVITA